MQASLSLTRCSTRPSQALRRQRTDGLVAQPGPANGRRATLLPSQAMSADTVQAISGILSTAIVAAGVYMVVSQEQPGTEAHEYEDQPACPKCGGSGYQPCMCQRWSDSDVGCSSCTSAAPGYTRCSACGGGGRARPLLKPIKMHVERTQL